MPKKNLLICFDAFGTLFTPRRPIAQQYGEVARLHGLSGFSDDDIAKSFKKAFKHESKENPNYGKKTGMGPEKWWSNIINNTFRPYYPPTNPTPPPNLIPSLLHRFNSSEGYTLYPDVLPLLNQLRMTHQPLTNDNGRVVIGLITNSDNRTPEILTSLGLRVNPLAYREKPSHPEAERVARGEFEIDFTVLSYDVGAEKPEEKIFKAAEEVLGDLLGADEQQTDSASSPSEWTKIYVGDEYEKDVLGATRAGWNAVLVDREEGLKSEGLEGVEWLGENSGQLFDVFKRAKAVGCGSLEELGKWLLSSRP